MQLHPSARAPNTWSRGLENHAGDAVIIRVYDYQGRRFLRVAYSQSNRVVINIRLVHVSGCCQNTTSSNSLIYLLSCHSPGDLCSWHLFLFKYHPASRTTSQPLGKRFHLSLLYFQLRICHLCGASQRCRISAVNKEAKLRYSNQTKTNKTNISASTNSEWGSHVSCKTSSLTETVLEILM